MSGTVARHADNLCARSKSRSVRGRPFVALGRWSWRAGARDRENGEDGQADTL